MLNKMKARKISGSYGSSFFSRGLEKMGVINLFDGYEVVTFSASILG